MNTSDGSLIIREAIPADIPALAHLHVSAWRAGSEFILPAGYANPPSLEIMERQWINAFRVIDHSWFCFVILDKDLLAGFAKGIPGAHPDFPGELSKIYISPEYRRKGLGTKMMGYVARRFISHGISSMLLYAEPLNPSCRFFEKLGGKPLLDDNNRFHGSYGWHDLQALAACSA